MKFIRHRRAFFSYFLHSKRKFYSSSNWKSVVGLEVHAQLNTESKLFSGAQNTFGGVVNNCVSLFDASVPGTLPVLNRKCVELGIITSLALSCKVNEVSTFDRKHYFYADLPAGYQITQQRAPLACDGVINFQVYTPGIHKKPYSKSSHIKQIQLEQDSGKSLHDTELRQSLVDLNRAGAPLMELVFEPDLENGEEAAALVKELVLIVQRLGACSGRMEEGALRVDANVSVHRPGEPFGTRTEIKNIGSIRGVAGAIRYEIARQMSLLEAGSIVSNETRAWDAANRVTVSMRDKEEVQDYRYMPEPNLPPLRVNLKTEHETQDILSVPLLKHQIPLLPEDSRQILREKFHLRPEFAIQIVNEPKLYNYFNKICGNSIRDTTKVANILINDLLTALNKNKIDLEQCPITSDHLTEVVDLVLEKKINTEICKQILDELLTTDGVDITDLINKKGWLIVTNEEEIEKICLNVIENNAKLVKQYKEGRNKTFKALLGLIAKNSKDKLDMSVVSRKLEELLKK